MTKMLARETRTAVLLAATAVVLGAAMAAQAQTATAARSDEATVLPVAASQATSALTARAAHPAATIQPAQADLDILRQLHPHPVALPLHPHEFREDGTHPTNVRVYVSMTRQPERDRAAIGG